MDNLNVQISPHTGELAMTAAERLREEGILIGIHKGREEGEHAANLRVAKALIKEGVNDEHISNLLELNIDKIKQLRKTIIKESA